MDITKLTNLHPATLAALGKACSEAAKESRDSLEEKTEHAVTETVTIQLDATVKVGADGFSRVVGKAKPWEIVSVLFTEVNSLRKAAGMAGIDLAKVAEMAESADPNLADEAKKVANEAIAAIKEETRSPRRGTVTIKGSAESL